ncbi:MAG: hypothetical protein GPJ51_11585 [Candidatus Heimdallarchaeota archaeon]|nr:hypothetical protein [Candidatus Heimdallarchaeota archaeon]
MVDSFFKRKSAINLLSLASFLFFVTAGIRLHFSVERIIELTSFSFYIPATPYDNVISSFTRLEAIIGTIALYSGIVLMMSFIVLVKIKLSKAEIAAAKLSIFLALFIGMDLLKILYRDVNDIGDFWAYLIVFFIYSVLLGISVLILKISLSAPDEGKKISVSTASVVFYFVLVILNTIVIIITGIFDTFTILAWGNLILFIVEGLLWVGLGIAIFKKLFQKPKTISRTPTSQPYAASTQPFAPSTQSFSKPQKVKIIEDNSKLPAGSKSLIIMCSDCTKGMAVAAVYMDVQVIGPNNPLPTRCAKCGSSNIDVTVQEVVGEESLSTTYKTTSQEPQPLSSSHEDWDLERKLNELEKQFQSKSAEGIQQALMEILAEVQDSKDLEHCEDVVKKLTDLSLRYNNAACPALGYMMYAGRYLDKKDYKTAYHFFEIAEKYAQKLPDKMILLSIQHNMRSCRNLM